MSCYCSIMMLCMVVACPSDAYAYLDPGTGSMMLQGLLAAFAAFVTAIGIYWRRIKTFLGRRKKAGDSPAEQGTDGNSEMR